MWVKESDVNPIDKVRSLQFFYTKEFIAAARLSDPRFKGRNVKLLLHLTGLQNKQHS